MHLTSARQQHVHLMSACPCGVRRPDAEICGYSAPSWGISWVLWHPGHTHGMHLPDLTFPPWNIFPLDFLHSFCFSSLFCFGHLSPRTSTHTHKIKRFLMVVFCPNSSYALQSAKQPHSPCVFIEIPFQSFSLLGASVQAY